MDVDRIPYLKKILECHQWRQENDPGFKIANLREANIRNQVLSLIYIYEELNGNDQIILKNYFEVDDQNKLLAKSRRKNFSRTIQRILSGQTADPQQDSALDVCAILVGLEPRPFEKGYDYGKIDVSKIKIPKSNPTKKSHQDKFPILGLVGMVAIVALVVILFLSKSSSIPEHQPDQPITINAEHFIVTNSNRIFPNQETQFFGDDGKPKVWYTNYNGKMEFYDTLGIHPENKEPLQPVTEEVVKVYLSDSQKEDETSKTTESNSPIAQNSILVRIFDKNYGQETETTSHLSQLLAKNYTITSSNNLTLEEKDIENALNGEIGDIQNELGEKVRFLCIGKIDFSYADSPDRKSWRKCTLSLNYSITDLKTGQIVNSNHKTFYGLGSSDTSAKTNTIKKIAL